MWARGSETLNGRGDSNKRVRGHGLHVSALQSAIRALDAQVAFQEPAELQGPKVEIPDPVVDLFEAHVLPDVDGRTLTQWRFHRMPPLVLT